jgi:hypothetical protein
MLGGYQFFGRGTRAKQFGDDCPENVNNCEQVRRWTLGWPKEAMSMAKSLKRCAGEPTDRSLHTGAGRLLPYIDDFW